MMLQALQVDSELLCRRSPVTVAALQARGLLFAPGVMLRGVAAHICAEALLAVPGVLGSLDLLLNPTGLVAGLTAGAGDLVGLPLAALRAGSPAQVLDDHCLANSCCWARPSHCISRFITRSQILSLVLSDFK